MRTRQRGIFTALLELGGPVFQKEERKRIRIEDCRIEDLYNRALGRFNTIIYKTLRTLKSVLNLKWF